MPLFEVTVAFLAIFIVAIVFLIFREPLAHFLGRTFRQLPTALDEAEDAFKRGRSEEP